MQRLVPLSVSILLLLTIQRTFAEDDVNELPNQLIFLDSEAQQQP